MASRLGRGRFLWGPATTSIATILITLSGLLADEKRTWIWIIILPSAAFILMHATVVAVRELSIVGRLARKYDRVLRRAIELLYNLGDISAFDLWMIDIYLPARRLNISSSWPYISLIKKLSRQLSVSLLDTRHQAPLLDIESGPHGLCFSYEKPLLWFDEQYLSTPPASIHNLWTSIDSDDSIELGRTYGILSISPLVDNIGMNCVGVLAVHVAPERDKASYAHGVLCSDKGLGYVKNTSEQLNGILTS